MKISCCPHAHPTMAEPVAVTATLKVAAPRAGGGDSHLGVRLSETRAPEDDLVLLVQDAVSSD